MPNQELLNYIKQQLQQGINPDQIKSSLLAKGWQQNDIEAAFNQTNPTSTNQNNPYTEQKLSLKPGFFTFKTLIILLVVILFLGGGVLASFMLVKLDKTDQSKEPLIQQVITSTPTSLPEIEQPSSPVAENLIACTSYKTSFVHPFSNETLQKEILGIIDGKCVYIEDMPNEGKMECKYTESERLEVAQYYIDVENAETGSTSASADLATGEKKVKYTLNGKEVENPLQEAIDTGICIISGY